MIMISLPVYYNAPFEFFMKRVGRIMTLYGIAPFEDVCNEKRKKNDIFA